MKIENMRAKRRIKIKYKKLWLRNYENIEEDVVKSHYEGKETIKCK